MARENPLWVWVRVPVRALLDAVGALKERAMLYHRMKNHRKGDQDDAAAEALKKALREQDDREGPTPG